MLRTGQHWEWDEPETNEDGTPAVHDIAEILGCTEDPNGDTSTWPEKVEDLPELKAAMTWAEDTDSERIDLISEDTFSSQLTQPYSQQAPNHYDELPEPDLQEAAMGVSCTDSDSPYYQEPSCPLNFSSTMPLMPTEIGYMLWSDTRAWEMPNCSVFEQYAVAGDNAFGAPGF